MQNKETKKIASARKQQGPLLYIIGSVIIIVLLVSTFLLFQNRLTNVAYKNVKVGSKTFTVEFADTDAKRAKGLSQRDSIPQDGGMLFDFKQYGDWRMWMVQMRFPIDIAWLTNDGTIVHIKQNAQPGDYPEIYRAPEQSWYALELPAGTFEKLDIQAGDAVQIK